MTRRQAQARFWMLFSMLGVKAIELRTPFIVLEWMRTSEQQKINVARGASKTMNSLHLKGVAVDIAFLSDIEDDGKLNYTPDKYKALGELWESLDPKCVWGGRFGDNLSTEKIEGWDSGHFQYGKWEDIA